MGFKPVQAPCIRPVHSGGVKMTKCQEDSSGDVDRIDSI